MKKHIRNLIRKILKVRENETIADSIDRKKYAYYKKKNCKKFTTEEFKNIIEDLGLKKGDTVIIHASWRAFIGYEGKPENIIDSIIDIIGENGTILMPAYTNNKEIFNYYDKTSAGYLAEIFRTKYNTIRSLDSTFSMCSLGKKAKELTKSHIESEYYFDKNSPYYNAIKTNCKILLLGLGKKPHKISLFHCVTYELKNTINCYKNVYSLNKNVTIIDEDGTKIHKRVIDRISKYQNNKKKFRELFQRVISKQNYRKINCLDIYLFESKKIYNKAKEYIILKKYNLYK